MGRDLGGRERGTGSCGLPAVPTRSQPNGRYRLTPRANPAHGRPSPLLTHPGQVHGRWHHPCPYAPIASGRGQNSRTDWGRARPLPPPNVIGSPRSRLLLQRHQPFSSPAAPDHGPNHPRPRPRPLPLPPMTMAKPARAPLTVVHTHDRPCLEPDPSTPPARLSPRSRPSLPTAV